MAAAASAMTQALPTLLTSRRAKLSCIGAEKPTRECSKRQSAVVPPGDLADKRVEAKPAKKLPKAYTMPICVRNTFIDTSAERSPSLERFYREREVSTCPSAHIGRFSRLFEADACGWESDGDSVTHMPSDAQETRSASEASPTDATRAGLCNILSLAEALSPPAQPAQFPYWDGQLTGGGALADPAVATPEVPCSSTFGDVYASWGEVGALPAERVAADGFFVRVPCARVFSDWQPSWCEAPPPQGAATDNGFVACGAAAAPRDAGLAGRAAADGAAPPPLDVTVAPGVPAPPTEPASGSEELPSVGSVAHAAGGGCKPCAFFHTVGCQSGPGCQFCHLCGPDERKLRRKAKMEARRADKLCRAGRRSGAAAPGAPEEDLDGAM